MLVSLSPNGGAFACVPGETGGRHLASRYLTLGMALACGPAAQAAMVFDELASGDLSNNPAQPTMLAVDLGSTFVHATCSSRDRDYFTLRLPPGTAIVSIKLQRCDGVEATFLGLQAGDAFTERPDQADLSRTLGYATFFRSDVDVDLLQRLSQAPHAIGFSGPLVGKDFTFWVEQKSTSPVSYELEFTVVRIPAPGVGLLGAVGLGLGIWSNRRVRASHRRVEANRSPFAAFAEVGRPRSVNG